MLFKPRLILLLWEELYWWHCYAWWCWDFLQLYFGEITSSILFMLVLEPLFLACISYLTPKWWWEASISILWILRNTSLLHSICTWTSSIYSFSFWGSLEAPIITKKDKVWIKGAFRPKLSVFIVCTSLICTYVGNMLTHWQGMFIFLNLKR